MEKQQATIREWNGFTVLKFNNTTFFTKDQNDIDKFIQLYNLELIPEQNSFDNAENLSYPT